VRQTLFYIPHEIWGVNVFGLGILLLVWAVVSIVVLARQFRRSTWSVEIRESLPLIAITGVAIGIVVPMIESQWRGVTIGMPIRGYGVLMLVGVVSGVGLAMFRARRLGVDPEIIVSLALWIFIAGIGGARLYYVIENWSVFRKPGDSPLTTLWEVLNIAEGGLVVYGSLLATLIAVVLFVRIKKVPGLALVDLIAPSMMLGLAFGRIGCLMNGCCYGGSSDVAWAVTFPDGSPPYKEQLDRGELQGIHFEADGEGRPVVSLIEPNGPAVKSGLSVGDRIVEVNGVRVGSHAVAREWLRDHREHIWLELSDGRTVGWPLPPPQQPADMYYSIRIGANAQGKPAITEVDPQSRAAAQGIALDDTIRVINGQPVATAEEANRVLFDVGSNVWLRRSDGQVFGWRLPRRSHPIHPTQVYSTIYSALISLALLAYYPRRRRDGEVIVLMILMYATARFLLEFLRIDEGTVLGLGLKTSQLLSIGMFVAAALLGVCIRRRPGQPAWPSAPQDG